MADELLVVENLEKYFPVTRGIIFQKQIASVKAVDGVSFTVKRGETLGVVGESGCGKSTMARCIMRLLDPTGGKVEFDGRDITSLSRAEMRPVRREMMMIFQDPYASLNARKRVGLHHRRVPRGAQDGHRGRDQAPGAGVARGGRPQPGALQPFPARVLRRAAPAHRRRARPRGEPQVDRLRRAGVGARRLGAGADPEPAEGSAAGVRPDVCVHRARPQRRAAHLRPRDGDVPRQGRRGRRGPPALQGAEASVHGGAALCSADPESRARQGARGDRARGRRAEPDQPAGRVPFPPALPAVRGGPLRRGGAASCVRSDRITRPPATTRSSGGR